VALDPRTELTDLHIHVGGAVAPHVLWAIAHDSGFKLPVKSYWDFCDLVYADPNKVTSLGDYLDILHQWTEKIQSSPAAIERSVYEVIGKEYRSSRVSLIELRFNPMKRNVGGERDLDYIIAAAVRGMDRASLDYGVKAGLIFCLAREFDYELNEIIVKKAEKYRAQGVIGIDLAGPEQHTLELGGDVDRYRDLFERARQAGLGTTVHTGETTHTGTEGVLAVIDKLKPARIGHGIAAAQSDEAMRKLVENGIVLEICPSSNLRTRAVENMVDLKRVFDRLRAGGVRLTINTDGTYLLGTHLRQEFDLLLDAGIVNDAEVASYIANARAASFIPR
jgi:adenosine deaminase